MKRKSKNTQVSISLEKNNIVVKIPFDKLQHILQKSIDCPYEVGPVKVINTEAFAGEMVFELERDPTDIAIAVEQAAYNVAMLEGSPNVVFSFEVEES